MRLLVLFTVLCATGCASQPSGTPASTVSPASNAATPAEAGRPAKTTKLIPERIKGPYKVVEKDGKRLYCTRERTTGSHVNFRNICLTPEEYADIEAKSREWKDALSSGPIPPNGISGGP